MMNHDQCPHSRLRNRIVRTDYKLGGWIFSDNSKESLFIKGQLDLSLNHDQDSAISC